MSLTIPKPRLSQEQLNKFLKDPEVVTLEVLFVVLTLCNIFALHKIVTEICPFPVAVTWFQLLVSLVFAYVLGEASREFPKCAFFPSFSIQFKLYESLTVPSLVYLGMITMANVLLYSIPSVALFPVVVAFAVALHHVSRFVGCGQIYLPIRWMSLGIMVLGFLLAALDPRSMGIRVFPLALIYALCSATFRAWCLESAMHVCEGRGNTLHNHKIFFGVLVLPFVAVLFGEWRIFQWMPMNFHRLFTWQTWGCLVTAGTIPFVKNIVANRMVRRTGQAPWRFLEVLSMVAVFVIGMITHRMVSFVGLVAFALVIGGRTIAMMDVLSKDPDERRRRLVQDAPQHGNAPPPTLNGYRHGEERPQQQHDYDPTGVADSFDRTLPQPQGTAMHEQNSGTAQPLKSQPATQQDIEMRGGINDPAPQQLYAPAPVHSSANPALFLSGNDTPTGHPLTPTHVDQPRLLGERNEG